MARRSARAISRARKRRSQPFSTGWPSRRKQIGPRRWRCRAMPAPRAWCPGFAEANPAGACSAGVLAAPVDRQRRQGGDPSRPVRECRRASRPAARRFTLFRPRQVGDLLHGPVRTRPRPGVQVSMVRPDRARSRSLSPASPAPWRSAQTRRARRRATPIYVPYPLVPPCRGAGSPFNMLVNYWWDAAPAWRGSPWDAMMLGMMSLAPAAGPAPRPGGDVRSLCLSWPMAIPARIRREARGHAWARRRPRTVAQMRQCCSTAARAAGR